MLLRSLLSVLVAISLSWALPSGPPNNALIVCEGISPDPGAHLSPAGDGNGGYVIATDIPLNGSYYQYDEGISYTGKMDFNIRGRAEGRISLLCSSSEASGRKYKFQGLFGAGQRP